MRQLQVLVELGNFDLLALTRTVGIVVQLAILVVVDDVVVLVVRLVADGKERLVQLLRAGRCSRPQLLEDGVVEIEAVVLDREVLDRVEVDLAVCARRAKLRVEDEDVFALFAP